MFTPVFFLQCHPDQRTAAYDALYEHEKERDSNRVSFIV